MSSRTTHAGSAVSEPGGRAEPGVSTDRSTTDRSGAATTEVQAPIEVVRVSVPERSFGSELRAIKIVWRRELIRFRADRLRMITSLVQPLLFLFVLGAGLQQLSRAGTHGVQLKTFIYPGILCIAVMFTAMFSAASIVWDREFGFLREMMVAPIRRSSIVIGKCLGGATVAGIQGVIVICLAGLVHVPYAPLLIIEIFVLQLLLAFAITAFGVMIAVRIKQMQSFMGVMQMVVMPMFFISGALFPVSGLPGWLTVLNRIDPLTYAVDPMRRIVFNHLSISPAARHALDPGVTWWGWHVPTVLEAGVIVALGLVMLGIAIWEFSATE
jgi:ABC-2 type transport system permease protein